MSNIENGFRYEAVKSALGQREDVSVVRETILSRHDGKKGILYDETSIVIAPKEGAIESAAFPEFVEGLLDIKPSMIRGKTISTFDTLSERHKRPIRVEVFPSLEAAQQVKE